MTEQDTIIACLPTPQCACCGGDVIQKTQPSRRHQVFELPKVKLDITEYQVFHGRCTQCGSTSQGKLPEAAPQGQMGANLMSFISVLAAKHHLSLSKIQNLLLELYGMSFSIGALSEAQSRVSSMLTPTHQALKKHIQQAPVIHADETSHPRNGSSRNRWVWLMASDDAVFQQIRYFRNQENAKFLLGKTQAVIVTDQCPSYNWIDPSKHQFCLAHIQRNLQQMADFSGQGLTALIGKKLVLLVNGIFRTQHRYEDGLLREVQWRRRMLRLRRSIQTLLEKGKQAPSQRYAGRCDYILKHEQGLWVFLEHDNIPLTNNEAERRLRGTVIMRKICYGTNSDVGEKFRSRVLSVVETCKKRKLSALNIISEIVQAVLSKSPYPDVFNLSSACQP